MKENDFDMAQEPSFLHTIKYKICNNYNNFLYYVGLKQKPKSDLLLHAERELTLIGYIPLEYQQEDDPNKWIQENVLELLQVFSKQGHSGFSSSYCINLFKKLASYELLSPLSGKDDEWEKVSDDLYQNIRCSHVFKNNRGEAYDINGKIFCDPDGSCYTDSKSSVKVTFPYTPKRQYIVKSNLVYDLEIMLHKIFW